MANHLFDGLTTRARGDAPFMRLPDGSRLDYAGMRARVARIGGALRAAGVAPGDRVAAQIEKSPEGMLLYLAVIGIGGVFLPLNTAYTNVELGYFLDDAEPSLVVCDPAAADAVRAIARGAKVMTLDRDGRGSLAEAADAAAGAFERAGRTARDLAAILYTSGTTGRSKGAMLTHDNLLSNAEALVEIWRFTQRDVLLHALPTYHTHGLFTAFNTVLRAGASLIVMPKFDAGAILRAMPEATVMMGVPTFYTRLLDAPDLTAEVAGALRLFVSGSAPLLAETHRAWRARTGHSILERYGITETNMNTSNPYAGERRAGTVGFPLPGVALRVVEPGSGRALDRGSIGMIEVKGPNVFAGYWRNPDKTAAEFRPDGFFITGDLGTIDADGYVSIVGRGKDLIISGGLNVYPKEVELEIDAIDGVLESAVIGVPHKDLGETVVAIVVRDRGAIVDEATISAALERRLAKFKLPKRIVFIADLPRNPMGKVQKKILRETYQNPVGAGP
jgi:malonyl-CoA/methylmalonyl-CoA synthetase